METNYVVESIGRSRENKRRKHVEYLVFWEGYPPEEATWEPGENLVRMADKVFGEFHMRYPKQPQDPQVKVEMLCFSLRFLLLFSLKFFVLISCFQDSYLFPLGL